MKKIFFTTIFIFCTFVTVYAEPLKVVSSFSPKTTAIIINGFTNESKIPVTISYLPAGTFDERLNYVFKENIDCILGPTNEEFYLASRLKMLVPYIPKDSYKVPLELKTTHGTWTNLWIEYISFLSNTNSLHTLGLYAPDTWIELLNPKLKGEIILPTYELGGTSYAVITSIWQLNGENTALHFAHQLNQQQLFYTENTEDAVTALLEEQRTVAILPLRLALKLENQYANLYATIVQDANRNILNGAAILRGTKNLTAAQKFIDYLMSDSCIQNLNDNGITNFWHVKEYRNDINLAKIHKVKTAMDDLSWTTLKKKENIQRWKKA